MIRYAAIAAAVRSLGQPVAWDDFWLTGLIAVTVTGALLVGPAVWGGASAWMRLGAEATFVTAVWAVTLGLLYRRGLVGMT